MSITIECKSIQSYHLFPSRELTILEYHSAIEPTIKGRKKQGEKNSLKEKRNLMAQKINKTKLKSFSKIHNNPTFKLTQKAPNQAADSESFNLSTKNRII